MDERYEDEVDYGDLPPAIDVEEVVLLYRHLLCHLGLARLDQCVGSGAHGAVYRVEREGQPCALKLTADVDEAVACAHLVGRPAEHVVRVHRVLALPDTVTEEDEDLAQWFVIERELLDPAPQRDARILRAIWELYEGRDDLMVPTGRQMLDRWRDRLRDVLPLTEIQRAVWILRDVGRGAAELAQIGLEWSDLHDGNIMRRRAGRYVIVDPGPGMMTGWRENNPVQIPTVRSSWRPGSRL
jgi:hypothetical protein